VAPCDLHMGRGNFHWEKEGFPPFSDNLFLDVGGVLSVAHLFPVQVSCC
jgi:hypothetical protein